MNKLSTPALLILLGLFFTDLYPQNSDKRGFFNQFQIDDTLTFDLEGLAIGEIYYFLPLTGSRYLIYDRMADALLITDLAKQHYQKLTVEPVMPGYQIQTLGVQLDPGKTGFWLHSYPNYYFKFDPDGHIIFHYTNSKFLAADKFYIDNNENIIISIIESPDEMFLTCFSLRTEEEKRLFRLKFPEILKNYIYRTEGGGLLADKNGDVYVANAMENKIYKFKPSGELQKVFDSSLNEFLIPSKPLQKDKNALAFLMRSKDFRLDTFISMHFLNPARIIALYAIDHKAHMEIFSLDGEVLNKAKIFPPEHMVYAGDNLIYLVHQPSTLDKQGNLVNPVILKYHYTGE